MNDSFETVIGLEIHAELKTASKLFCACPSRFGSPPNRDICPICMGHPGTMPSLNRHAVTLALRAGIALGATPHLLSRFDRKHYTYPDLPKAYQITQFYHPICTGGELEVSGKHFRITRIHMEEDAGKLIHENGAIKVDYNRCGVPLIEIVTEPDFRSAEEASAFCRTLREVLLFTGVCDGKMNEGSFRCDVNLSLHRVGEPFGERTEIKNLNSFRFIEKAIRAEEARQRRILREGGRVVRQTLRFDEKREVTLPMRSKEDSTDYRYFPEPDLPPLRIDAAELEDLRRTLPPLPAVFRAKFTEEYRLSGEVTEQLLSSPEIAARFMRCASQTAYPLICGRLFGACVGDREVNPASFAAVSDMLGREEITQSDAKLLAASLTERDFDPILEAEARGMRLILDPVALREPISRALTQVIAENPDRARAYRSGKTQLLGFFIGAIKRQIDLPASPKLISETVKQLLDQTEDPT